MNDFSIRLALGLAVLGGVFVLPARATSFTDALLIGSAIFAALGLAILWSANRGNRFCLALALLLFGLCVAGPVIVVCIDVRDARKRNGSRMTV
jgi:hypothetical protein